MLSKIDRDFSFVQTALGLRARRQELLASNLANSDTPNYKAKDLDFSAALRSAMSGAGGPLSLSRTSGAHLSGSSSSVSSGAIKFRSALQPSLDGNTVDPNVERAMLAENTLQYQFLLERANSQIRDLAKVLSEGK